MYTSNPLKRLYFNTKDISSKVDFPIQNGLLGPGKHIGCPSYPERQIDGQLRWTYWDDLVRYYQVLREKNEDLVMILFSHVYFTMAILDYYEALKAEDDIKYTSIN